MHINHCSQLNQLHVKHEGCHRYHRCKWKYYHCAMSAEKQTKEGLLPVCNLLHLHTIPSSFVWFQKSSPFISYTCNKTNLNVYIWFYYYHRLPDLVKLAISPVMKLFDQTLLQMDMTNILRYISQGIDHCCWCCYSSGVMIHSVVVWMLNQVEPCVKTARDQSVRYVIFKI